VTRNSVRCFKLVSHLLASLLSCDHQWHHYYDLAIYHYSFVIYQRVSDDAMEQPRPEFMSQAELYISERVKYMRIVDHDMGIVHANAEEAARAQISEGTPGKGRRVNCRRASSQPRSPSSIHCELQAVL